MAWTTGGIAMNVLETAKRLGLDASALNEGKVIDFTVPIDSISEFRDLFLPAT
jgi:hypothetical protein